MTEPRSPLTKSARQARIAELIERNDVASQTELAARLGDEGLVVSQGTLSKDLLELGAVRVRTAGGQFRYALLAGEATAGSASAALARLGRLCGELLLSAEASANLVVARTPPGAAQFFASAIDKVGWDAVLGTIAGDDTVMLITRDPAGGQALADTLLGLSAT
ncbi:MAG: arginine repressor [Propionibacteriaceae bacterium]|nr:arginine repressor [Propionibacteriaceae bacterium]